MYLLVIETLKVINKFYLYFVPYFTIMLYLYYVTFFFANQKWNTERDINYFVEKEIEAPAVPKCWMDNINEILPIRW